MSNFGKIISGVIAILKYQDQVLLIQRVKEPYKGKYSLVGGKIEFGEHLHESVKREVKEETGLEPVSCDYIGFIHELIKGDGENICHFNMHLFQMELEHLNFVESDEGKLKAFNIDEIEKHKDDFLPSDYLMLKEIFVNKNKVNHFSLVEQKGNVYDMLKFERI